VLEVDDLEASVRQADAATRVQPLTFTVRATMREQLAHAGQRRLEVRHRLPP
jgi:hypothetical protein